MRRLKFNFIKISCVIYKAHSTPLYVLPLTFVQVRFVAARSTAYRILVAVSPFSPASGSARDYTVHIAQQKVEASISGSPRARSPPLSITQNPKRSEIVASDRPGSGRCEEVQTDLHMG